MSHVQQQFPCMQKFLVPALDWARNELEGRVLFYSAREEPDVPETLVAAAPKKAATKKISNAALAEQVFSFSAQMKMLLRQQSVMTSGPPPKNPGTPSRAAGFVVEQAAIAPCFKMPPVSQGLLSPAKVGRAPAALVGPHPKGASGRTKGITAVTALSQQSAALTALVSHMAGVPGIISSSTKGTVKRERMQQDLAARRSTFFLQVQQQVFKKLNPSKLLPKTE